MLEDALTKVNDRVTFLGLLRRHCEQSLNMGSTMGLLVADITRFHKINSAFGYRAGDAVLGQFAKAMTQVARKRDLVARLGDDEFALILPGIMNEGHAVLAAAKLLRILEVPFVVAENQIRVSASIGIAVCPAHGSHSENLLGKAEEALRHARATGLAYATAKAEKQHRWSDKDMEFELQTAIAAGELELHYQPKLDVRSKTPIGAEALIRWNSPVRGEVGPGDFIVVAEQSGLITGMTQWAINTALRQSQQWPHDGASVAVNLSASILNDQTLIDLLRGSLGIWEAKADRLILEVTESSAMADPESSFELFRRIKHLGARISLDDFGTGYSSLAYFRNIPADELKLDRSFVSAMLKDRADRRIARLVIDLAHAFGMTVVAEGVEDADTYRLLAKLGCDHAQGFFIGKPMPQAEFCAWLRHYQGLTRAGPRLARAGTQPAAAAKRRALG